MKKVHDCYCCRCRHQGSLHQESLHQCQRCCCHGTKGRKAYPIEFLKVGLGWMGAEVKEEEGGWLELLSVSAVVLVRWL